ncbi:hypothetical protein EUBSIR_02656 [[Eubacterium] siraeum DSM 15702]|uniref:Uncharacterized protein n=1 Tax=[Eubacterium] siraeum DSM 15702 TaxID=428128 RepID=B0MS20_9FIRM|nr:hypothetical protein EUBSIR_02656 [[Eubacterium] siraeum DSM 15702]
MQNSISICLPCYAKMTVKYIKSRLFAKTTLFQAANLLIFC